MHLRGRRIPLLPQEAAQTKIDVPVICMLLCPQPVASTPERLPMLSGVGVNVERAFIKRGPFINGAAWRVAGPGPPPREPRMFYLHVCLFFVFEAPRRRQVAQIY